MLIKALLNCFSEGTQQPAHLGVPTARVGPHCVRLRVLLPLPLLRRGGRRHAPHHGHPLRLRRRRRGSLLRHQVLPAARRRISVRRGLLEKELVRCFIFVRLFFIDFPV